VVNDSSPSPRTPWETREILGVRIAAATLQDALGHVTASVERREPILIGVVNAAKVVNMRNDSALREDVLSSDVIYADGMAVVWASRLLGRPLPERVAGIDLMNAILARAAERGWGVYCLGADPDTLARAVERMRADHRGLLVVGQQHGYFATDEEEAVAQRIAQSRPDILFVAMTSPKKEKFLARWRGQLGAPVCHGVGGSFDVLAGKVQRAPEGWQRLGLEWLYRVKQEPRRLWRRYLVTNTVFCGLVAAEVFRRGLRSQ
jgi:N-acetylglucosaminyldiphosphoundecaprenol N-acetyl-beta-D-mannosaminyltransferase